MRYDRSIKLILLSAMVSVVLGMFAPVFTAHAATISSGFTPTDSAKSYNYYGALTACINGLAGRWNYHGNGVLSSSDASVGAWFSNPGFGAVNPTIGFFLSGLGTGFTTGSNGENVGCGGNNIQWIPDAVTVWHYDNAVSLLCNIGAKPTGGLRCGATGASYTSPPDATQFQANVTSKIGASPASISPAGEYIKYSAPFKAGCLSSDNPTNPTPDTNPADSGRNNYYKNITLIDASGNPTTANYLGIRKPGDTIWAYINPDGGNVLSTCIGLETSMNNSATAYLASVLKNPDSLPSSGSQGSGSGSNDNSCGSQVSGIGWIICPALDALTKLDDGMWKLVSGLLNVNPIVQPGSIYTAWGSIRSIANVIFVIFFLIIIFSQLTGAGITNYGVKKMLPKIIIAAILVNVSFLIIQLAVDLANVIGSSLYSFIVGLAPTYTVTWGSALSMLVGGIAGLAGVVIVVAAAGGATALFFILLGLALIGALGLITAVLTLIFRQAAVIILVILAPLAFVAYLLPNTEPWFKKWRGLLFSMLMMYPMAALIFGGAQFAAATIIGDGKDFWNVMIGLTMMSLPLFTLPFIARQGGSILGKVNGALKGVTDRAKQPISNVRKSYSDRAAARYKNNESGRRFNPSRRLSRAWEGGRQTRETQTETAKTEFKSQLSNNQVRRARPFGGRIDGQAIDVAAAAAKENLSIDATRTHNRMLDQNPIVNARHGETMGLNERKYQAEQRLEQAQSLNTQRLMGNRGFDQLRTDVDHAKGRAEAATEDAGRHVEQAGGTLQVRELTSRAKEQKENVEAHTKAVLDTASTVIDPNDPNLTDIGREALTIDESDRGERIADKLDQRVEASADAQAVAAQNQEIADVLVSSNAPGSAAVRAAGVAGTAGVARVQASATAATAKFRQENVAAAQTLYVDQGLNTDKLLSVIKTGDNVDRTGTVIGKATDEQIEAAMQMVVDTSSPKNDAAIYDRLAKLPDDTPEKQRTKLKLQQAYGAMLVRGKRPKSIGGKILGNLAAGTVDRKTSTPGLEPFEDIAFEILRVGKLGPETFTEIDKDELSAWAKVAQKVYTTVRADGTVDTFDDLKPAERLNLGSVVNDIHTAFDSPLINKALAPEQKVEMNNILVALEGKVPLPPPTTSPNTPPTTGP